MQPGDLVQLYRSDDDLVSIGEDNGAAGRDFPVGALCIYLGMNREWNRPRPAVNILIDGITGWVWQNEIVPATRATPS